jgi:hypothetical protein
LLYRQSAESVANVLFVQLFAYFLPLPVRLLGGQLVAAMGDWIEIQHNPIRFFCWFFMSIVFLRAAEERRFFALRENAFRAPDFGPIKARYALSYALN